MRKNSIKNTRINSEVQKALAEIIRSEIKDPRVPQFTSVTDVEVAPDLKTCKVWVSFLTQPERYDDAMKGLNKAEGFIRASLAKKINLRNTPEIRFVLDTSIEYGNRMSKLIDDTMKNMEEKKKKYGITDDSDDISSDED